MKNDLLSLALSEVMEPRKGVVSVGSFKPSEEDIRSIERELAAHKNRVYEIPVEHYFYTGKDNVPMYAREMRIPAGTMLTGRTHKTQHECVLSAGSMTIWTVGGQIRVSAPFQFTSLPGAKRVGYAHTDSVFTTYHVTDKTDLDEIIAELIEEGADQPLDLMVAEDSPQGVIK